MKKLLSTILVTILVATGLAGTALAAFTGGNLIRVVYDTVGSKEYATDLGPWVTLTVDAATGNLPVGGGVDAVTLTNIGAASWSNLVVGYYLLDVTTGAQKVAVAGPAGGLTSASRKFTSFNGAAGQVNSTYNLAVAVGSASVLLADKTVGNTYFARMDSSGASPGSYGGWLTAGTNPSGTMSLAALATTGYVDQTLYSWGAANLGLQGATAGAASFVVRTMADGSTIINPSVADTTPPIVTAFSMPAASSSLAVAVTTFTATDNVGVTGYLITEIATAPLATDPGWSATAPTAFTFSSAGTRTAYAWAADAAGNVSAGVPANVTITLPTYSVTYNGNGNSGGSAPVDAGGPYLPGATVTALTSGSLARTGYSFSGWNSAANGAGTAYATGATFTMGAANVILYAKWTANSYTVVFDSNGGSAVASQSVAYNTIATSPIAPTRTGNTFAGWYSDAALTTVFAFTTPITADTTLYAKWTTNSYTVTFNSNGGSAVASQSVAYNTVATSPISPIRTGYTFAGWYSDAALTTVFAFTTPITTDTTLYAKWTTNSYTVTFNSNGGSAVASQSVAYNTVATSPISPTRTGYAFAGWYSDAALTTVFAFTTPITADTTLYAKWTPLPTINVTVTSNPAGLAIIVDGTTYAGSKTFSWLPGSSHTINTLTQQNGVAGTRYNFANWSDGKALSHTVVCPASGSITYTATFSTQYQLITNILPAGAGTMSPISGGWYAAGSVVNLNVIPNKDYSFLNFTGPVANSGSASTTVTMNAPITATANLTGIPLLTTSIGAKSGATNARSWPVTLTNSGAGTALSAKINGLTLTQTFGAVCTPVINTSFPIIVGDIGKGGAATGTVSINFSSCPAAARFTSIITYGATNGGGGVKTYTNQFR